MSRTETWAYCDTSALLKQYVRQPGHTTLARLLIKHRVVSSIILTLELHSALAQQVRMGAIATLAQPAAWKQIAEDQKSWMLIELTIDVSVSAQNLVEIYQLRTLDAIHVASAKVFAFRTRAPVLFVSADARQLKAASALGFEIAEV